MTVRSSPFVLDTHQGFRLRGDIRVANGTSPRSVVVVVHGFKGFKDWGFFPYVCRELAEAGHAVVSFNFSHNGIGDDPQAFTELERFARNTLTRELDELGAVLEAVRSGSLAGLDAPLRVGLLGHSRGGGQAVLAAREHPWLQALVTWAAVADFDRWSDELKEEWRSAGRILIMNSRTGQQMPLDAAVLRDFEENADRLDILAGARSVTQPYLVVHGSDDETVAFEEGRRLATSAPSARLLFVEGAGHTFGAGHPFDGPGPELTEALAATREHFGRHLGR